MGDLPPKVGGERVSRQQVAALHRAGIEALAHPGDDKPSEAGEVPVEVLLRSRCFGPDDAFVVPEYDHDALRHFATAGNGDWLAEGDHEGFADAVARSVRLAEHGGAALAARLAAGLATARQYNESRFETELLAAWQAILGEGLNKMRS